MEKQIDLTLFSDIIVRVKKIDLRDIEDLIFFKNIGNLFVLEHDSSAYEEEFETWIQKIDSNPVIFGYIQYIEKIWNELVFVIKVEDIKEWCKIIFNLTINETKNIPEPYTIYRKYEEFKLTKDKKVIDQINYEIHSEMLIHLLNIILLNYSKGV